VPRLLIGNEFNEDRAGLVDAKQKKTGWWTQRVIWFAEDHDIMVLAVAPEPRYLEYVTGLTGVHADTLTILVPPPGEMGVGVLSPDRMLWPDFVAEVKAAAERLRVTEVRSLHPDLSVAQLVDAAGLGDRLPGRGFLLQGGGRIVNSKALFRAIAAGVGAALPAGGVCSTRAAGTDLIMGLLERGHPVMLKHDFRAGGRGNEIISPIEGVVPVGAQRAVVITGRQALHDYFDQRWDWLTSSGQTQFVVERYYPDSKAVFAEFAITGEGVRLAGQGEMVSAPLAAAEIIPPQGLSTEQVNELVDGGRRLSEALRAIGYRGMLSADAIVTPDHKVMFTEYNGRITGSTHIYGIVGEKLVGADYAESRILYEREGWPVPSLEEAMTALKDADLLFDPHRKTGTVLVMPFNRSNSTIRYCVIAEDLADADRYRKAVEALFEPTTNRACH